MPTKLQQVARVRAKTSATGEQSHDRLKHPRSISRKASVCVCGGEVGWGGGSKGGATLKQRRNF